MRKTRSWWVWLLIESTYVPSSQPNWSQEYRIIKQGRAANGEYGPYAMWRLVGVFETKEEAVAMRKLVEG